MVVGVVVAVAFNSRFIGRPVARSIILIPWAIPPVVNGIIWNWMVHSKIGILNYVLSASAHPAATSPGSPTRAGR